MLRQPLHAAADISLPAPEGFKAQNASPPAVKFPAAGSLDSKRHSWELCGLYWAVLVELDSREVHLVRIVCNSWRCSKCAPRKAERLAKKVANVQLTSMLTLTCDPSKFDCQDDAWAAIIPAWGQVVRMLKTRGFHFWWKWVKGATEKGWPHLHVVIGGDFLPFLIVQGLWKQVYGATQVHIEKVHSQAGAVHYLLRHLTRQDGTIAYIPLRGRLTDCSKDFYDESHAVAADPASSPDAVSDDAPDGQDVDALAARPRHVLLSRTLADVDGFVSLATLYFACLVDWEADRQMYRIRPPPGLDALELGERLVGIRGLRIA